MSNTGEEYYDILNKDGHPTGEILPKSVVHNRKLIHASVFIWIYNKNGEVLLQLRAKNKKYFPNVWDVSVAGHISAGDNPTQTCIREIKEEIGVDIDARDLRQVDYLYDDEHPEFCWVYILHKELDATKLTMQKEEVVGLKLESIHDIETARSRSGYENTYAARNSRIYDSAFLEIKKNLG